MMARTMRKIHAPAYWPIVFGAQASEKRLSVVEVWKAIFIMWPPEEVIEVESEVWDEWSMSMSMPSDSERSRREKRLDTKGIY